MKKILFSLLFIITFQNAFSTHIIGGEMRYEYIGPGTAPNSKQYRIRLLLLRGGTGASFISQYIVGIFNNDNNQKVIGDAGPGPAPNGGFDNWIAREDFVAPLPVPILSSPCIQNPPTFDYTYKTYSFILELPNNNTGYTLVFQTFSRETSVNIFPNQSANYNCVIPGLNVLPSPLIDNSPKYNLPISVICANSPFTLDFSAGDIDGDSLVYNFCDAYNGGAATTADFRDQAPPPYVSVTYVNPFTSVTPLGTGPSINPQTGIISGIAPAAGRYVVCVCASVFRNGVLITVHRKDLIVEVSGCIPLAASPNFAPITCDGFTVTFNENSTGNPNTFFWNFGDPASGGANTSTLQFPTHTFTTAGIFNIKLVVSISGQCVDSVTKPLSVFPGFFPNFTIPPVLCTNVPVQFTDATTTAYGVVNSWHWNFGDLTTLADTSHLNNPTYSYNTTGNYNVKLVVTNSMGCKDSLFRDVTITGPPILNLLPHDTTYCGLDSLQLTATGTGAFSWSPLTNIIGANTGTPLVFPNTQTKYIVTLNASGCISKDSLTVTPKLNLTNTITGTSPICEEDTITLNGSSNYAANINWQWSPAASVEFPVQQNTRAFPTITTNYILTTTWGQHCISIANKNIIVKPLAIPNAGPDVAICGGQQSVQLTASGGNTYQWTPGTGLSNANIPNPVATPGNTTVYTVAVGVTGCSKIRVDSLIVNVRALPLLTIINDTLICDIDTLQLTTIGTGNFNWSPNYMISNTTIANPLVSPNVPTTYFVRLADAFGCHSDDTVFVDVKDHVTLFAGNDTTICQTDGFRINTISDALHYKWTPAVYLNNDTTKQPFTIPLTSTTYHVVANIGKCQSQDDVDIKVVPYPAANAGTDNTICPGFSVQLNASGGSNYLWSPVTFLNNRSIANPISTRPNSSIRYIVAVTDTLGCPKPVRDTVWVYVDPKVIANAGPRDTSIVIGEPLFLNGSGGTTYLWDPPTWLNDATIKNPVALPQNNIQYVLTAISANGCINTDTIDIKLYKIAPDMYVPTAFTPNGDGNNDIFKPILIGMKELRYFRVYNRLGQLLYSTGEIGKGWDGRFAGRGQDPATYVWMAEAITYKGDVRFKKGYVVLIRQ